MKSQKHDDNTTRIAILENTISHINETLIAIRQDIGGIKQDVKDLSNKVDSDIKEFRHEISEDMKGLGEEIKELKQEGKSQFRWTMGYLISFFLGTFSVITAFILKIVHFI